MNRNTEAHFSQTPTVDIGRSKFDVSHNVKTTFNAGDIIPFFIQDILPGDTVKMNTAHVVRMMTPISPVMDNAFLDTYFFFCPNRLIWEHWANFMGENDTAPWTQTTEYEIPQIIAPATTGWTKGSLADYMGYPTKIPEYKADAMPFRAYAKIYNDWFRDENLKNPLYIHMGDADIQGIDITDANLDPVTDVEKGAVCAKAAKVHDYFTSALPEPQKGPAVGISIGDSAPVVYSSDFENKAQWSNYPKQPTWDGEKVIIRQNTGSPHLSDELVDNTNWNPNGSYGMAVDLSQAVGTTINQLRQAFQIQKFYEKQALYGSRYIEVLKGHFGVTNPDYRLQRTEYLGGMRTPININQVVQTDATSQQLGGEYVDGVWTWGMSDLSPQGNTAAYSLTTGRDQDLFTHSFTEHGWLLGLAVVRQQNTYQQGLNRMFSRKSKFDFYWPEFANLGNQDIKNKEIMLQGTSADEQVFGYQEAYAEYRYHPDIVTSEMRSNYSQSLDIWHWADYYETLPSLGDEWIDATKANIARTLAIQNHDQFMGDFYFNCVMTRPMPLYSVPGLIDHH